MPALNAQSAILDICREFSESRPNRKVVPSTPRLSFWTVLFRHNPGTQQITCLQRGWRCIQNGGYGEKGENNWVRDAKVKMNKWQKKLKFSSRKNRKNRHVLHVRVLGIRQSVRGLVFAVHCFFFVILKLGVMGLSVLYCGTPYRYLIQCCSSEHIIFLFHEALGNKLSYRYIVTNLSFLRGSDCKYRESADKLRKSKILVRRFSIFTVRAS